MVHVADLRRDDLAARRAGEEQELIGLVRADVAEDAAVTRRRRTTPAASPACMRCGPRPIVWTTPADRAGLDQLAGLDRRAVLEPLAVHDRVDPLASAACTRRTSASCSSVVMPGLSAM